MINIIVAVADNNVIGANNTLPFSLPEDMARFKFLTTNNIIIMGKNTYLSIGKPLPNRINIVVSTSLEPQNSDIICLDSIDKAIDYAQQLAKSLNKEIFICGGEKIYAQTLDYADTLYITKVHCSPQGDSYFPNIPEQFKLQESKHIFDNNISTHFCVYKKQK